MSDANTPEQNVPMTPPAAEQPAAAPTPVPTAAPPQPEAAAPTAPPQGSPYGAPAPAQPLTAENDRQLGMWAHIGGIVGFLPSLIIWLMFKDRGPVTNVEAKEALNWQITFTIVYIAALILTSILGAIVWILGLFLWLVPLAVWVLNVVWSIMGGMRVNSGGSYRYPINFRFIK